MARMCLLAQSISLLLLLLLWTTSTVLIQEIIKGYKLLFIHIPVLLEQTDLKEKWFEPVQLNFKTFLNVTQEKLMLEAWYMCVRITSLPFWSQAWRGVWKVKWENWEFNKETGTHVFGKGRSILWVSLQKVKHRCVYSPWLPKQTQLWNKEDNFALCQFLSSLKAKLIEHYLLSVFLSYFV